MPTPDLATIRSHINRLGGYRQFAHARQINPRTAERIFSGKQPAPPWLKRELEDAANG